MSRANQDLMRQKRLAALQSLATTSSLGSDAIRNIAPLQHGPTPYFASQADSPSSGSVKPVSSSSRPASHSSKIHTLSSSSSYSKPASHSSKTLSPSYSKPASHSSKIHTLSSSSSYSKPASHSSKTLSPSYSSPAPHSSNIHTLSGTFSGGGTKVAPNSSSRTQVISETQLYVNLPSMSISSEQLVEFVRLQFGVEVTVSHMNTKAQTGGGSKNFCFLECKNKEDMDYLLTEMHDSVIGDWDCPIQVYSKKDRD